MLVVNLARLKGEVSDAAIQKMAMVIRGADKLSTSTTVNADWTLSQAGPLNKVADHVDGIAANSAVARKVPKAFDEYLNAAQVKPFIGTTVNPNNLPEGYLYGKILVGKDAAGNETFREVIYIAKPNKDKMPS